MTTKRLREFINERVNSNFMEKKNLLTVFLKIPRPNDNDRLSLFKKLNSCQQYSRDRNGRMFEDIIADALILNNVPFKRQVDIDDIGRITADIKTSRSDDCHHRLDFVVGDVRPNTNISEYTVLSCKTSCRERWKQDDWSLTSSPKMFYLLTLSNDYPPSAKFQESSTRKMITCSPKKKDGRFHQEDFDDLMAYLKHTN